MNRGRLLRAIAAAAALIALVGCGETEPTATTEIEQSQPSDRPESTPSGDATTGAPDELGGWADQHCAASVALLTGWHEMDDEEDWMLVATSIAEDMATYREAIDGLDAGPIDPAMWDDYQTEVREWDDELQAAPDQVASIPEDLREDRSLEPSADGVVGVYFLIGEFMQQPTLSIGNTIGGPDGYDPGANGIRACDELSSLWFGVD